MNEIKLKIENGEELMKLFDELSKVHKNKIIFNALKKSADPIKNEIFSEFNKNYKSSKNLKKSFKISFQKNKTGIKIGIINYIYKFLNFGTKERFYKIKKSVLSKKIKHNTGKIKGSNFFYNAVDRVKDQAVSLVQGSIIDEIEKLIKKYNKKL